MNLEGWVRKRALAHPKSTVLSHSAGYLLWVVYVLVLHDAPTLRKAIKNLTGSMGR